ncbi:MAG TPA: PKD domain-containing protein [Herpetosiphonaceae bacterium]
MSSFKTSRWLARLITLILLVSLIPLGSVSAQLPALPDSAMQTQTTSCSPTTLITRSGSRFMCGAQEFKVVGVNLREGIHLYEMMVQGSSTVVAAETVYRQLKKASDMGANVMRIFLPRQDKPTNQANIARLTAFIDFATKASPPPPTEGILNDFIAYRANTPAPAPNMKFLVTFTDFYYTANKGNQNAIIAGDYDAYFHEDNVNLTTLKPEWFTTTGAINYTTNYTSLVTETVSLLRNNPAIFAWELGNELKAGTSQDMIQFVADVSGKIKQHDPSHMVTTGFLSSWHAAATDLGAFDALHPSTIDFGSIHMYNNEWSSSPCHDNQACDYTYHHQDSDYQNFLRAGLPYIVGELGFTGALHSRSVAGFPGGTWIDHNHEINIRLDQNNGDSGLPRTRNIYNMVNALYDRLQANGVFAWAFFFADPPDPAAPGGDFVTDALGMDNTIHTDWDGLYDVYTCRGILLNNPGQFCAQYYNNTALREPAIYTEHVFTPNHTLSYAWPAAPNPNVPADAFSARWTGRIIAATAEDYQVTATVDDGIRVFIDSMIVIDEWRAQGPTTFTQTVQLAPGAHTITIEYFDSTGPGAIDVSWGPAQAPTNTVDTALIIDSSGSMRTNDGSNRRHAAARAYLNASLDADFVGVVDFDGSAHTWSPVVPVGQNRQQLDAAINQIDSAGDTNIGAGLARGCEELMRAETADAPSYNQYKAAILLADGEGTLNSEYQCFARNGWPVYTFGFGQADPTQLQTIASATGGEYKRLTTQDLVCEFQMVRAKIARGTISPCVTTQVSQGTTTTLTQNVPINQERATFSGSWTSGNDVVLSLTSPSGRTINRTTSATDVLHNQGTTFETYSVINPESGAWRINLFGASVPASSVSVVFGASTVPAPAEALPTADAGGPYTTFVGQPVTFDASGSQDQDGTIARYQWDVTGDGVFDFTTTAPTLAHTYTTTGTVTLTLQVTDNDGRVAGDTATVTIQPPTHPLDAFVRGNDLALYRRSFRNNTWGPWQWFSTLPGLAGSQPAVAAGANGQLDFFVRVGNNTLRHRTYRDGFWSEWQNLGGNLQSDPTVVTGENGQIDVYARAETDLALYRLRFRNGAWGTWQRLTSIAGEAGSQPALVVRSNGRIDVFTRASDNTLRQRTYRNGAWEAAQNLNGNLQSDPTVIAGPNGQIDVYARGTNLSLLRRTFQNNVWGPWQSISSLPGVTGSQPALVPGPDDQLDVFARGSDNALYQRTYRSGAWGAWQNLSGGLQSDPTVVSPQ